MKKKLHSTFYFLFFLFCVTSLKGADGHENNGRAICEEELSGEHPSSDFDLSLDGLEETTINYIQSNQRPFITTWKTDNPGPSGDDQLIISTNSSNYTYNYTVDWGDGTSNTGVAGDIKHTYAIPGIYSVSISGTFPTILLDSREFADNEKLLSIDQWGDIEWLTMRRSFYNCHNLQGNFTDSPDLSKVTDMSQMFYGTNVFNYPIGDWDVSKITNMSNLFQLAEVFNQDLNSWDVGNVTNMTGMFRDAYAFNQNLSAWNVSNVTTMENMFLGTAFNQDIGSWDVSNVKNMEILTLRLSIENYDALLIGWSSLPRLQQNVPFFIRNSQYCEGESARQKMITDFGWTFRDEGRADGCIQPFITTWKTDNPGPSRDNQIIISTNSSNYTYDYQVDWGDGTSDSGVTSNITHTYATPGTYSVRVSGTFPQILLNSVEFSDNEKIISIEQWGDIEWRSMASSFYNCHNLQGNFYDSPDLSRVTSMAYMFSGAYSFNHPIERWDVSSVTNMSYLFENATIFNQNLNRWNVSNVTNMNGMFKSATTFNQNLSAWDVSNVTSMLEGFSQTNLSIEHYDALLKGWSSLSSLQSNVIFNVGNSQYCAEEASRQKIIDNFGWTITDGGKVDSCNENIQRPFVTTWKTDNPGPSNYNQITIPTFSGETYDYKVEWGDGTSDFGVTGNITHTYRAPGTYTISISGIFPRIFNEALYQPNYLIPVARSDREKLMSIDQWGDIEWSSMNQAFADCRNLQGNFTDRPDLSKVTSMYRMFSGTPFNHPIGDWDVSNVTNMFGLFWSSAYFNQDISNWDVSNVTDMAFMFRYTTNFNQDLSAWNVSKVKSMNKMLERVMLTTENYDALLQGWSSLPSLQQNVTFKEGESQYCAGEVARQKLIDDYGWTITDGGKSENCNPEGEGRPFVTTWKTDHPGQSDDNQIKIPTASGEQYDYAVDWGDGSSDAGLTGDSTHTYSSPGTYTVSISGTFPRIHFETSQTDRQKLMSIEQWGDIAWSSMNGAFAGCTSLQGNFSDSPDLSNVTDMSRMFQNALAFNQDIGAWDVSKVTNMRYMFSEVGQPGRERFFIYAFNQDIGAWDVSNVTDMTGMFDGAISFNQDIGSWNVANVEDMQYMFSNTKLFNQDISAWDVSKVKSMYGMFDSAESFNQYIGNWNVGNVENMAYMFRGAATFDQGLSEWQVSRVTSMFEMFSNSNLSSDNYDALLNGWSSLSSLQSGVRLGSGNIQYCQGEDGRQKLIDNYGWIITDGGKTAACNNDKQRPFITTWKTDNPGPSNDNQITIPTATGEVYDYTVDWGDGSSDSGLTGNSTHTYGSSGTYTVSISGTFPRIHFETSQTDRQKLMSIEQWGDIEWSSMNEAFKHCENLEGNFTDSPDLSNINDMSGMFFGAESFNHPVGDWDVSTVTDMSYLFHDCFSFNQDLNSWNVASVTNMFSMFFRAYDFNQNLNAWDVSSVTTMYAMLYFARAFNQNVGAWNVSKVTSMEYLFAQTNLSAENYDAVLRGWASLPSLQSNVIFQSRDISYCDAEAARQKLIDVYGWIIIDGGKAENCNQNDQRPFITTWKTDNPGPSSNNQITIPTATGEVYDYTVDWGDGSSDSGLSGDSTHTYDAPGIYTVSISGTFPRIHFETSQTDRQKLMSIEQWGDIEWSSMNYAFFHCENLEGNFTDSPNLLNVNDMQGMFQGATSFNHPIGDWNVINVINMSSMFNEASSFNQDIGDWKVEGVEFMNNMFYQASSFNQDVGSWNIRSVRDMSGMFVGVNLSVENYDSILNKWLYNSESIFGGVRFQGGNNQYCSSEANRQKLIDVYGWIITDGGKAKSCGTKAFITTWKTDNPGPSSNNQITIPTATGEVYDYTVDWGDGSSDVGLTGNSTHTYGSSGTYTVSISGTFPRIHFETSQTDRQKLMSIEQWGDIEWSSMNEAFFHCENLVGNFTDSPNLLNLKDMHKMFHGATSFNHPIGDWNVGRVTDMSSMFNEASSFNQDIGDWNVANVEVMNNLFYQATSFDQDIGSWNIRSVKDMSGMLYGVNLSVENYDALLIGWEEDSTALNSNVRFQGGSNQYCDGATARQRLITIHGWTITDGGDNCSLNATNLKSLSMYPNPSSDILNVSFDATAKIKDFKIYDPAGRLIQTIDAKETERPNGYQLNVSHLDKGLYFLRASYSSGKVEQKHLLIK